MVRIKSGEAPSSIGRLDRQREVTLSANVLPGGSQQKIISDLNQDADDLHMGAWLSHRTPRHFEGTGPHRHTISSLAIALTFIFMYIVLAAQFESFLHPFTILLTLPIAVPFGILSLLHVRPDA